MPTDRPVLLRSSTTPWLAFRSPQPKCALRLFCFPHAGGGASVFRTWSRDLPSEVDLCPVQYPGRETRIRDRPHADLEPLVEEARLALLPYLDGPFCFLGHSMGALVAFELARRLKRYDGICPAHLFACGFAAPQFPYRSALRHDLPREALVRELRKLDGTPQEAIECAELLEFVLPLLRADLRICELYRFEGGEPLPCPITAYGGAGDAEATVAELAAWREHTGSTFELKMLPGGHFFTQSSRQEFLGTLSADLRGLLNGH